MEYFIIKCIQKATVLISSSYLFTKRFNHNLFLFFRDQITIYLNHYIFPKVIYQNLKN